jgi:hypothetical protein
MNETRKEKKSRKQHLQFSFSFPHFSFFLSFSATKQMGKKNQLFYRAHIIE